MLDPEDQTSGGPPNDIIVKAKLFQEGKYARKNREKGKVLYAEPMEQQESIKWELKSTHIEAYETFMAKCGNLMRTMYKAQKPPKKRQSKKCVGR